MRGTSILVLIFITLQGTAQLELEKDELDYGEVIRGSERLVENNLINTGEESITLLRVEVQSSEYDIRTDKRKVAPGDTMRLRLKLNPVSEGIRKDELKLFFSSETLTIDIRADIKYVDSADNSPCPDFEKSPDKRPVDWQALFKVIDKETKEPLHNSEILLTGMNGTAVSLTTDRQGQVLATLPIDYYTMKVNRKGYAKYSLESYVNRNNKDFTLELIPGVGGVAVMRPGKKGDKEEEEPPLLISVKEDKEPLTVVVQGEEKMDNSSAALDKEFSIDEFKPNNAVFLVDVSTSMKEQERMELLKSSMIQLASMMRPEDIISIVTYATSTDVVLSGEHVSDVERITEIIESLEAEGKTAGEAGLKKAYKICKKHFILNGNNHVYLATDGAFNKGSEKVKKLAKTMTEKKDIQLSILSIRGSKWVDEKMKDLAEAGSGEHLSVQEEKDQGELKALVKELSRR